MEKKLTAAYQLEQRIRRRFNEGIKKYQLIASNDRILMGLSGGKDSLALMQFLGDRMRRSGGHLHVEALHVRVKSIAYQSDETYLMKCANEYGVKLHIRYIDFKADKQEKRSPCFLCSWNRRKTLFQLAQELGCNKIALGHHMDDIIQTAMMNLNYVGQFSTMPALLKMRKFPLTIIRPLCRVEERDLEKWAVVQNYQELVMQCPYEDLSQRNAIKLLFKQMEEQNPEMRYNFWHALEKEGKLIE